MTVLHFHNPKRRTISAESSVEPRQTSMSTHQCQSTQKCSCLPHACLIKPCSCKEIKVCSFAHPGPGPRAQSHMLQNIHKMNTDTLTLTTAPLFPLVGAATPLVEQQHLSTLGRQSADTGRVPTLTVEPLGPLARHIPQWSQCGASNWILKTLTRGYRLQFASTPPSFSGVIHSRPRGKEALILQQEIEALKHKGAIRIVPPEQCQAGFYSRYFLVPKKGGGLRPILDLRALNKYLRTYIYSEC